jgi:hypothetical protein
VRKLLTKLYRRHFDFLACSKAELALHFVSHLISFESVGSTVREAQHSGKSPQRTSRGFIHSYANEEGAKP